MKAEADPRFVSVQVFPLDEAKGYEVSVQLAPRLPVGRMDGKIELHTDRPDQPLLSIPFHGVIPKKK